MENKYSQPVTELVVTRWAMPPQVIASIRPYDALDANSDEARMAAAVHAGSRFATYMLDIAAEDDKEKLMDLSALDILGLGQAQIEQLLTLEDTIGQRVNGLSL